MVQQKQRQYRDQIEEADGTITNIYHGPAQDPYSWFASKFFTAYDSIRQHSGAMSEGELGIINQVRDLFIRLDPGVEGVLREKPKPGRPVGSRNKRKK